MNYLDKIIGEIEEHSVEGIIECFKHGVDPNDHFKGEPLIYELTSEYLRSYRFKDCVKAFVDHGLVFEDKALLAVLLDDPAMLDQELNNDPAGIERRYTLRCAFTPLHEVTLLHICAEFNHVSCAEVLLKHGADVNAAAGVDEHGFGGQTPVYHTVNQIFNHSASMLDWLLSHDIALQITVKGLIWGKGYEWETFIPGVNPINYAMMGSLPQMQRDEATVAKVVTLLLKHTFGIDYVPPNVPNKYLAR